MISNSERKATAPSGASQPARPSTPGPLTDDSDRIVRDEEVQRLVGLSRSTIWREEKAGRFPKRIKISRQAVGWRLKDIQEWLRSRPLAQGEQQ